METMLEILSSYGVGALLLCVVLYLVYRVVEGLLQHYKNKDKVAANEADAKAQLELRQADNAMMVEVIHSLEKLRDIPERTAEAVQLALDAAKVHTSEQENISADREADEYQEIVNLLKDLGANRSFMISFHNGGNDVIGVGYPRMTMLHEYFSYGLQPIGCEYQKVPRSSLQFVYNQLREKGECFIEEVDDLKEIDIGIYQRLLNHGVHSAYFKPLKRDGVIWALIGVEYCDNYAGKPSTEAIGLRLTEGAFLLERYQRRDEEAKRKRGELNG